MNPNLTRKRFVEAHQDLPPSQVVALVGSHRHVAWPPLCPACGAAASTHIDVAKIFGRRSQYGNHGYYRFILRMHIPFCQPCAERHQEVVRRVPSVLWQLLSHAGCALVHWRDRRRRHPLEDFPNRRGRCQHRAPASTRWAESSCW